MHAEIVEDDMLPAGEPVTSRMADGVQTRCGILLGETRDLPHEAEEYFGHIRTLPLHITSSVGLTRRFLRIQRSQIYNPHLYIVFVIDRTSKDEQ